MVRIRVLGVVVLILAGAFDVGPASAQEEAASVQAQEEPEARDGEQEALARQVFEAGRAYFGRAEYERAAESFQEAYRLSGRAVLLVNVARAFEALGRDAEAIELLVRAIEEDEEVRPVAEPRLTRLRAQVESDEEADAAAPPEQPGVEGARVAEVDEGLGALFWIGVVTAGVGAALLAVSIGTGIASNDIHGELEQSCPERICSPDRQDEIDRGHSLAVASTVTLALGGATAAAGLVLILLETLSGESPSVVEVTGGPGELGLGLRAGF